MSENRWRLLKVVEIKWQAWGIGVAVSFGCAGEWAVCVVIGPALLMLGVERGNL